jgi:hypothetical protein
MSGSSASDTLYDGYDSYDSYDYSSGSDGNAAFRKNRPTEGRWIAEVANTPSPYVNVVAWVLRYESVGRQGLNSAASHPSAPVALAHQDPLAIKAIYTALSALPNAGRVSLKVDLEIDGRLTNRYITVESVKELPKLMERLQDYMKGKNGTPSSDTEAEEFRLLQIGHTAHGLVTIDRPIAGAAGGYCFQLALRAHYKRLGKLRLANLGGCTTGEAITKRLFDSHEFTGGSVTTLADVKTLPFPITIIDSHGHTLYYSQYETAPDDRKLHLPRVELVYSHNHYTLKRQTCPCGGYSHPVANIYFDLETYFDYDTTYATPYAIGWSTGRAKSKVRIRSSISDMLSEVPMNIPHRFIAYNGSGFDFFLLFNALQQRGAQYIHMDVVPGVGVLRLDFKLQRYDAMQSCFDPYRYLMCSLDKASGGMKLDLDHKAVDTWWNTEASRHGDDVWEEFDLAFPKAEEYLKTDVRALAKVVKNYSRPEVYGKSWFNSPTISSHTYKDFLKATKLEQRQIYENHIMDYIRKALFAGRVEVVRQLLEALDDWVMSDVTSLYPFVMMECEYPCGDIHEFTGDPPKEAKLWVGTCAIVQSTMTTARKCIIPLRSTEAGVALDWSDGQDLEDIIITSVDADLIMDCGGAVQVEHGYYWTETSTTTFDCIGEWKAKKMQQDEWKEAGDDRYDEAMRNMWKLKQNSLSGKVIQKPGTACVEYRTMGETAHDSYRTCHPDSKISKLGDQLYRVEHPVNDRTHTKPCYLGVFIYAYARKHMWVTGLHTAKVAYMDTDSFLIKRADIPPEMVVGDGYGGFKLEITNIGGGLTLAPKCYFLEGDIDPDHPDRRIVIKYRFKGVPMKCLWRKTNKCEWKRIKDNVREFMMAVYKGDVWVLSEKFIRVGTFIKLRRTPMLIRGGAKGAGVPHPKPKAKAKRPRKRRRGCKSKATSTFRSNSPRVAF